MGLDVQFYIKPFVEISPDVLEKIREKFYLKYPDDYPTMEWEDKDLLADEQGLIVVRDLERFYSIGYERGKWPYIQEMGDWLTIHFGELAEVLYGDDCSHHSRYLQWGYIRPLLIEHWNDVANNPYYGWNT